MVFDNRWQTNSNLIDSMGTSCYQDTFVSVGACAQLHELLGAIFLAALQAFKQSFSIEWWPPSPHRPKHHFCSSFLVEHRHQIRHQIRHIRQTRQDPTKFQGAGQSRVFEKSGCSPEAKLLPIQSNCAPKFCYNRYVKQQN